MIQLLSSAENPKLKQLRKLLSSSSERRKSQRCVLESPLFLKDILSQNPQLIDHLICTEIFYEENENQLQNFSCYTAPEPLLKPHTSGIFQGVFAILKRPQLKIAWEKSVLTLIYLDHLQNPSNVGAILRNATAYNVDAVLLSKGCVDAFHPDSIRASAGSCFSIPILEEIDQSKLTELPNDLRWHALSLDAKSSLTKTAFPARSGFIFGTEGMGLSMSTINAFQAHPLLIEQSERIDSLNVAVSSGIVLHHRYVSLS